jgi:F-type H+-transporting ATPase subunit a
MAIFVGLLPILLPLPFFVLGLLVCIVQTAVFCLLSTVYISLAVQHADHDSEHKTSAAAHAH